MFDVARTLARGTAPNSPLNTRVSRNRRFTVARGRLDDYRTIRARYNCDVNDVVLAVITGALRNWLMSRGEAAAPTTTVRAMAPLPVYVDDTFDASSRGRAISQVAPFLVDLPVGEGNAVVRLSQIAHATESNPTAGSLVDARTIVTLSGFAPPTLHAMGIRVATGLSPRLFNLLITNAPGAQSQIYVAGAKLLESYAVPPLLNNQVLAIGVTSYNGMLYFGINADRDAMSDVDVLPVLLAESLDELLEAAQ
jgi:WS/DGAT/MGAT family acyltransferase